MSTELIPVQATTLVQPDDYPVERAIAAWLTAKAGRTNSEPTRRAYEETIASYRAACQHEGIDLDSPDARRLADLAEQWGRRRLANSHHQGPVAPATFNQRMAILSSFFEYAAKRGLFPHGNPIARFVERRRTDEYGSAIPLEPEQIADTLAAIDRTTTQGKRDYALLVVALTTGRRLSELVRMRMQDIRVVGQKATITFMAKGGKTMLDQLERDVTRVLLDYLHAAHNADLWNTDQPVWVSCSRQNPGAALSKKAIANIVEKRLGTSKVHALRHTFAHAMERAGATTSAIQRKLGHSSLSTTGRYLKALDRAENPHGRALCVMFGIGDEDE